MTISESTEEKIRAAWFASIPEAFNLEPNFGASLAGTPCSGSRAPTHTDLPKKSQNPKASPPKVPQIFSRNSA
jgi:hypothetical protein